MNGKEIRNIETLTVDQRTEVCYISGLNLPTFKLFQLLLVHVNQASDRTNNTISITNFQTIYPLHPTFIKSK